MKLITSIFFLAVGLFCQAQSNLDDNANLINHSTFGAVMIPVPENVKRNMNNADLAERMGFVYFESADKKIEITFRQMDKMNLKQVKKMMDSFSVGLYNGKILRSEIIKENNLKIFVTSIEGQWNGKGEIIGMFRYYFNFDGKSYNLLMRYPKENIPQCQNLLSNMILNIKTQ
ncbi:MAG: hypothetical protein OCD76_17470 [Reichenbachiella sp.]